MEPTGSHNGGEQYLVGELRRVVLKLVIASKGAPDGWDCSPELGGQLGATPCHGQPPPHSQHR